MLDAIPTLPTIMGIAAAILSIIAFLPYILDILRRRTKPQRATWAVWAVLATVSATAQFASGNSQAIGFAFIQAGAATLIAALALAYGAKRKFTKLDLLTLAGVAFGMMLWYASDVPAYALAMLVGLGFLGAIPTFVKTFAEPESETLSTWILLLASSVLAVFAVSWTDPIMLVYPAYLAILRGGVLLAYAAGRVWRSIGGIAEMPKTASPVVF